MCSLTARIPESGIDTLVTIIACQMVTMGFVAFDYGEALMTGT
jgi:hypothetical protein